MPHASTLVGAPRRAEHPVSAELLAEALRGDLPHAELLLTTADPATRGDRAALTGAALLRVLGYGDLDGARRLLALADTPGQPRTTAHHAVTALVAMVVGGPEWDRWEVSAVEADDPDVRRLVDIRHAVDGADLDPLGASRPDAAGELLSAIAAMREPESAWRPEFAPEGGPVHPPLARTVRDLDLAARMIRDARWVDARELLRRVSEFATSTGLRVLARMADGYRALALALSGEHETALVLARAVLGDRLARDLPGSTFAARHALLHVAVTRRDRESVRGVIEASSRYRLDDAVYPAGLLWDLSESVAISPSSNSWRERLREDARAVPGCRSLSFVLDFLAPTASTAADTDLRARVLDLARGRLGNYELGRALSRLAELRLRDADREDSRRLFAEAAVEFSVAGAAAWTTRAVAARDQIARPEGAVWSPFILMRLTDQEERIVSLAAQGLSNKEIGRRLYLSPRTVGGHLYNAFPKLGVTSRAALRDAMIQREALAEREVTPAGSARRAS